MAEKIDDFGLVAGEPEHGRPPKTLEELTIAEIGGQILAPLLKGLAASTGHSYRSQLPALKKLKSRVPLGTPLTRGGSFTQNGYVRPEFVYHSAPVHPIELPELSRLTNALDVVHDQTRKLGKKFRDLMDKEKLTPEIVHNMQSFLPDIIGLDAREYELYNYERVPQEERNQDYSKLLASSLASDKLPDISLKFTINGHDESISIANGSIDIGEKGKRPLAQVLFALGLVGDVLADRSQVEKDFILDSLGGAVQKLPPVQARVYNYLAEQLHDKGYEDPEKILRDSKCDLDREVLRTALTRLLPYAEIYETASKLRGEEQPDYFLRALEKIKSALGIRATDPVCKDGYECAMLLEGMLDYAIAKSGANEAPALAALKESYVAQCEKLLIPKANEPAKLPAVAQVLDFPEVPEITRAFAEAYAAETFAERDTPAADRAWSMRMRASFKEEPSGEGTQR